MAACAAPAVPTRHKPTRMCTLLHYPARAASGMSGRYHPCAIVCPHHPGMHTHMHDSCAPKYLCIATTRAAWCRAATPRNPSPCQEQRERAGRGAERADTQEPQSQHERPHGGCRQGEQLPADTCPCVLDPWPQHRERD